MAAKDMALNPTILKFTDYPFSYSLVGLLFTVAGINFLQDSQFFAYLTISGFVGTFLAMINPVRRAIEYSRYNRKANKTIDDQESSKQDVSKQQYIKRAVKTKNITIEIDKTVGFIYFAFTIAVFPIALSSHSLLERFSFTDIDNRSICDPTCVTTLATFFSVSIMIILVYEAYRRAELLDQYVETTRIYLEGIDKSAYIVPSTLDNLGRAIEQQDWHTAERWRDSIKEEIDKEEKFSVERESKLQTHVRAIFGILEEDRNQRRRPEGEFAETYNRMRSFSLSNSLISHIYTDMPKVYVQFYACSFLDNENHNLEKAMDELAEERIKKIFTSIDIGAEPKEEDSLTKHNHTTNEWMEMDGIIDGFNELAIQKDLKKVTITESNVKDLFSVGLPEGVIAQLTKENADILSKRLVKLAVDIRGIRRKINQNKTKLSRYSRDLDRSMQYLSDAISASANPLMGACSMCLNSNFRSQKDIEKYNKMIRNIPWSRIRHRYLSNHLEDISEMADKLD